MSLARSIVASQKSVLSSLCNQQDQEARIDSLVSPSNHRYLSLHIHQHRNRILTEIFRAKQVGQNRRAVSFLDVSRTMDAMILACIVDSGGARISISCCFLLVGFTLREPEQ